MTEVLARVAWGALNVGSAVVSGASATAATAQQVFSGHPIRAFTTAKTGVAGFISDLTTAAGLTVGVVNPIAPEALYMKEEDWALLLNPVDALVRLNHWTSWSETTRPAAPQDYTPNDVNIFLQAARVLTVASALCYAQQDEAQQPLGQRWHCNVLDEDNAQVMLLKLNTAVYNGVNPTIIVAFRGTELPDVDNRRQFIPDWWRNFQFNLTPYSRDAQDGQVAQGFLNGWRTLEPFVMDEIHRYSENNGNTTVDVFVTGHSQGGALAAISLLDLLNVQASTDVPFQVRGCLTVAQPNVGDVDYTKALNAAVARANIPNDLLANEDITGIDPVVSVPPFTGSATPAGTLWVVRVGDPTTGPVSPARHTEIAEARWPQVVRRIVTSAPLHWPGGRVGYLHALSE